MKQQTSGNLAQLARLLQRRFACISSRTFVVLAVDVGWARPNTDDVATQRLPVFQLI